MEIEEESKKIPQAIRKLIDQQNTLPSLAAVTRKITGEYQAGRLSDKLLKRCRAWTKARLAVISGRSI